MYEVRMSTKVRDCLSYAEVPEERYSDGDWVPFYVVKKATEINSQNPRVPVNYQDIWFNLHDETVRRSTNTGYVTSRVSFPSTMVERKDKVIEVLKTVKNMLGVHEFAKLCDVSHWAVYAWLNKNGNVPLSAIMKACELLNESHWTLLDNVRLCGKKYCVLHRNNLTEKEREYLESIIDWINSDGHLRVDGWSFSIAQHENNREVLRELMEKIVGLFKLDRKCIKLYEREHLVVLKVDSAALRQLLVLKYKVRPGKKAEHLDVKDVNMRRVANYLSSEGSFYFGGRGLAVEVVASNSKKIRNKFYKFLQQEGYHPSNSGNSICLQRMEESLKFLVEVWDYLTESKRHQAAKIVQKPETFFKLRVNTESVRPLIDRFLRKYGRNQLHGLVNQAGAQFGIEYSKRSIEHWIYPGSERRIPLFVVNALCDTMKEKLEKYVPEYMVKAFEITSSYL